MSNVETGYSSDEIAGYSSRNCFIHYSLLTAYQNGYTHGKIHMPKFASTCTT